MHCCRRRSALEQHGLRTVTGRRRIVLLVLAAIALGSVLALRWLLQADNVAPALLDLAGKSLGLEITARGPGEYRLRGTPQLIVRDVLVLQPGSNTPLLRAERMLIAVPWSTLRARGRELTATRVELDAPIVDIAALQRWLDTRPPSTAPLPALTRGIGIRHGTLLGEGWKIEQLEAQLPAFAPGQPLRAHLAGRYASPPLAAPFDLHVAMTHSSLPAGVGIVGDIAPQAHEWRLPSRINLSGVLANRDGLRMDRAVLGASLRYRSDRNELPFSIGIAGSLGLSEGLALAPVALALRGSGPVPVLDAHGAVSLDADLRIRLDGTLAQWPETWPALPPPLGQSRSPLPFTLDYRGDRDFSSIVSLQLQRDDARFDGRFRLFDVLAWLEAGSSGSPLPPLTGTLSAPRMDISGAVLEGVEMMLEDPGIPAAPPLQ